MYLHGGLVYTPLSMVFMMSMRVCSEALQILDSEGGTGGSMAKGFIKTLKSTKFLGMLYTLKVMLPSLTILSKTFQTGPANVSRIIRNVSKTKRKLPKLLADHKQLGLLRKDIETRLKTCNLVVDESDEEEVHSIAERYMNAMVFNIDERFPSNVMDILDALSIFNVENIPTGQESDEFIEHGIHAIEVLSKYFYENAAIKGRELLAEGDGFKIDLLSLRRKWVTLEENLSRNKLKQRYTATKWALKKICANDVVSHDEYPINCSRAKIAHVIPVSNALPERRGSAIKRIKTSKRCTLKMDALNALLVISLNDPRPGTPEANELIMHVSQTYSKRRQYKKTPVSRWYDTYPPRHLPPRQLPPILPMRQLPPRQLPPRQLPPLRYTHHEG